MRHRGWKAAWPVAMFLLCLMAVTQLAWAQGGSRGTVTVTAVDPNGRVVQGAKLTLIDTKTGDARTAETLEKGSYTFQGLLSGLYQLTVEKQGFAPLSFQSVVVEAARTTDLTATLKVGGATDEVKVTAEAAPLVEVSASAIGTNYDVKAIEDLPLSGRDATQLLSFVPGAATNSGGARIFNGERAASQSTAVDGVMANSSRFKDEANGNTPAQAVRIENVEEVVVQTDQLDLNQGYGQSNMQSYFNTRRGGEKYHGRVYGELANSRLNAFSFMSDYYIAQAVLAGKTHAEAVATANKNRSSHHFVWGPSVGGPIPIPHFKDRLFFFASYTQESYPGNSTITSIFPAGGSVKNGSTGNYQSDLQNGVYTYKDTSGNLQTVNLFEQAAAANTSLGLGLPTKVNSTIATELGNINSSLNSDSQLVADSADPYNLTDVSFGYPGNTTNYYPTVRVDYVATPNLRVNFAYNQSKYDEPYAGAPPYQGKTYYSMASNYKKNYYTGALGVEWAITPRLLNQFHGGYLYYYEGGAPLAGNEYLMQDLVAWNSVESLTGSGQLHASPQSNLYPLISLSDNVVWQHGAHNVSFGLSGYREQDHYWNPPLGWSEYFLGSLASGDPAIQAFQSTSSSSAYGLPNASYSQTQIAQSFYGILTGRLSAYWNPNALLSSGSFGPGRVVLDEVQQGMGIYVQDSWHIQPSLTINYGIRWDFTGDDHDVNSIYHTVLPNDIWGVSGYNNQFHPGSFNNTGTPMYYAKQHAYAPWKVSPQPSLALAWNPEVTEGILGKLVGGKSTVIRAGYALRNYTESFQNFWNYASNQGSFFGNNYYSNAAMATNGVQPYASFAPGTYSLGDALPSSVIGVDIKTYAKNVTQESESFLMGGVEGINPHIRQPYTQSWNLGIQRELGAHNALEIRYVGNHGSREWLPINPNEVNVFENGFLLEFQQAQKNLSASSNANFGSAGNTNNMPIMTTAFNGDSSQWSNASFITDLQNGAVGDFASSLTAASYICNLVSGMATPCQTNASLSGTGVGPYPSNIFQANPYSSGNKTGYLDAEGSSSYHSLQVEFRQKNYHGANFTANYTFAKNLGIRPVLGGDSSNFYQVTLRDMKLSRNPSDTDVRQIFHLLGTYDLPFGKGKAFLAGNSLLDKFVGGWTIGTVNTFQSGLPFLLSGGNHTFNDFTDGGIVLSNVSLSQLRRAVGVHHNWAAGNVNYINSKYISSSYMTPNKTAGTLGLRPWLWGPHRFTSDASVTKVIPLHSGVKFSIQSEIYNVFNHPTWGLGLNSSTSFSPQSATNVANVAGGSFGVSNSVGSARSIHFRANIEF